MGRLRRADFERLHAGIVEALEAGLAHQGASIDDYRDANGERGSMQNEFLIHLREGQPCPRCGGTVTKLVAAGRGTYVCRNCQRAPRRRRRVAGAVSEPPLPAGFEAGHWSDAEAATGCTVVLAPPEGAVASGDVRGGGPGTREMDLLTRSRTHRGSMPC